MRTSGQLCAGIRRPTASNFRFLHKASKTNPTSSGWGSIASQHVIGSRGLYKKRRAWGLSDKRQLFPLGGREAYMSLNMSSLSPCHVVRAQKSAHDQEEATIASKKPETCAQPSQANSLRPCPSLRRLPPPAGGARHELHVRPKGLGARIALLSMHTRWELQMRGAARVL